MRALISQKGQIATFIVVVIVLVALSAALLMGGIVTKELKFANRQSLSAQAEALARAAIECTLAYLQDAQQNNALDTYIIPENGNYTANPALAGKCKDSLGISGTSNRGIDITLLAIPLGLGGGNTFSIERVTGIGRAGSAVRAVSVNDPFTCDKLAVFSDQWPDINGDKDICSSPTSPTQEGDEFIWGDNSGETRSDLCADFYDTIGGDGTGYADDSFDDDEVVGCFTSDDEHALQGICDENDTGYVPILREQVERGDAPPFKTGCDPPWCDPPGIGNNTWLNNTATTSLAYHPSGYAGTHSDAPPITKNIVISPPEGKPIYVDSGQNITIRTWKNIYLRNVILVAHNSSGGTGNDINIGVMQTGDDYDDGDNIAGIVDIRGATLIALGKIRIGNKEENSILRPSRILANDRTIIKAFRFSSAADTIKIHAEELIDMPGTCIAAPKGIEVVAHDGYLNAPRLLFGGLQTILEDTSHGSTIKLAAEARDPSGDPCEGKYTGADVLKCGSVNISQGSIKDRDTYASANKVIEIVAAQRVDVRSAKILSQNWQVKIENQPIAAKTVGTPEIRAENAVIRAKKTVQLSSEGAVQGDITIGGAKMVSTDKNVNIYANKDLTDGDVGTPTYIKAMGSDVNLFSDKDQGDGIGNISLTDLRIAAKGWVTIAAKTGGAGGATKKVTLEYPCILSGSKDANAGGLISIGGRDETYLLSSDDGCSVTDPSDPGNFQNQQCTFLYAHAHDESQNPKISIGRKVGNSTTHSDRVRVKKGFFLTNEELFPKNPGGFISFKADDKTSPQSGGAGPFWISLCSNGGYDSCAQTDGPGQNFVACYDAEEPICDPAGANQYGCNYTQPFPPPSPACPLPDFVDEAIIDATTYDPFDDIADFQCIPTLCADEDLMPPGYENQCL